MTTQEFLKGQEKKFKELLVQNYPLQLAVKTVMAMQSKRIFLNGLNASNAKIGDYSRKPIYVSGKLSQDSNIRSFPLKGKDGEDRFKNGKKHKSGYFESYYSFKRTIGKNKRVGTVDLFLTGTLHRHWANGNAVGKAEARKINANHYVTAVTEDDVKKIERYGNVFGLSSQEKLLFFKTIQREVVKFLNK